VITDRKTRWLLAIVLFAAVFAIVAIIAARFIAAHFEPYIREQAILYLEKRFDSDVELTALRVYLPHLSPLKLVLSRGRGAMARVEGEGVSLHHKRSESRLPLFVMKSFAFDIDLGNLFDTPKVARSVAIDGMEINIPPKGKRPDFHSGGEDHPDTGVLIEDVLITNSRLMIFPRETDKVPLRFDLHRVHLESAGTSVAMKYDATLTNARPPGEIQSQGSFGPWAATEPGDTPLAGEYDFKDADLGVFDAIGGILHSTGKFEGNLDSINVRGQASVPNFRLKSAGNPVHLATQFEVLVDGTNGNTILKPVTGSIGTTPFITSGGVIKNETSDRRKINLEVTIPRGNIRDLLRLAMKGSPFMEGAVLLKARIDIPPFSGRVKEKLVLDGNFELSQARFLESEIQEKIDNFSRRGQGKPKNPEIVDIPSGLAGSFNLMNQIVTFRSLSFAVPGAGVDLTGRYDLDKDDLDFHGTLKLQAKVSQTFTGWKRWALKPVDPFFAKQGAGTLIHIQVTGTSKDPQFGRDRGKKDSEAAIQPRPVAEAQTGNDAAKKR
jgi:hypothetical protein